jgi:CO dehydrogenase/acetyl-CoA synthase beta subunit
LTSENVLKSIRQYLIHEKESGKKIRYYQSPQDTSSFLEQSKIKVGVNRYKEIILQEETALELGGFGLQSFSLIHPIINNDQIQNGKITVLGPELQDTSQSRVHFGMFIVIGVDSLSELTLQDLRGLNLISNGIEGFSIRTIPRKFWCRINSSLLENGFSMEIFGNAIFHLYKAKFKDLIQSSEIFFINNDPQSIKEFIQITSSISNLHLERWKNKVDVWKKKVDCDYDWGCEICPYFAECEDIKDVLNFRNQLEN